MKKLWKRIVKAFTKWRLKTISAKFKKAFQEADKKMKNAGMRRHERRQFFRELWHGDVDRLFDFLGDE